MRQRLVAELPADSERVLAVIDPFLVGTPIWAQPATLLEGAGRQVSVYSDITPELPVDSLTAAAADAADFGAQVIVAVGGGSALDAGKLIALLLAHGGPLSRYYGENRVPGPVLPVVALPTTAGTGSEVTPVAVIADSERELKVGVSSPYLVPAVALVDPELTMAAPASVTAFAGIDALVHAVESYTAAPFSSEAATDSAAAVPVFTGRNVLTAGLSLQAAGRIHRWLPVAVRDGGDRRARAELSVGALQAGIAFGPTGTHLSHALQYPIGALTKTPHGLGTGCCFPTCWTFSRRMPRPPCGSASSVRRSASRQIRAPSWRRWSNSTASSGSHRTWPSWASSAGKLPASSSSRSSRSGSWRSLRCRLTPCCCTRSWTTPWPAR
ncbi:iron-containing alcohol dehydrogenase [Microbacterium elymi]|uniref:Iron-containing alcohol dehydrogenase n=1 Tax=Microbacterium elymi TaxID=2909587 RepID=A0ABY5NN10_9MICO|nr:iron-containing alcohol dehydrogenase [Microbacterium elymi]UUT36474.1 iron-containing alcohol dehydrogenase [Microbacterium elymi]